MSRNWNGKRQEPRHAREAALLVAGAVVLAGILISPPALRGKAKHEPLKESEVLDLLRNDVPSQRVEVVARQFGIAFPLTPEIESRLRSAGASGELLDALRELSNKPKAPSDLEVLSKPGHAQVYVDDVFQGETSEKGTLKVPNLKPGKHQVRLSRQGYPDFEKTVQVAAGQAVQLEATLAAAKPADPAAPPSPSPQTAAPKPVRVSGSAEQGRIIYQPKPEYPAMAKSARVQGVVKLDAVIGKDGAVQELKVLSGHPLLVKSALEAVKNWRYQPVTMEGRPVAVETEIDVNFTLTDENKIYNVGGDVSAPVPTFSPEPPYTDAARNAKVQGAVVLSIVVDAKGGVRDVQVLKPLGHGLDQQAAETVKTWKFRPALRNGVPVPVRVNIRVNFQMLNN